MASSIIKDTYCRVDIFNNIVIEEVVIATPLDPLEAYLISSSRYTNLMRCIKTKE